MSMTKNGKNIHHDVVEGILSMLLDAETLMRFKCVSKTWYALINDPKFVAKHLSNSFNKKNSTTRIVVRNLVQKDTNESETEEEVISFLNFCDNDIVNVNDDDDDCGGVNDQSVLSSIETFCAGGLKKIGGSFIVIGHCNGIVCLAHSTSGGVILCNPTIQESKLLPPPPYLQDPQVFNRPTCESVHAVGFGYDVILNEYKIIKIGFSEVEHCDDGFVICHPSKAAVHTLGTDCWREIKAACLETETSVLLPEQFQVYLNQMCYWFGHEQYKELDLFGFMEDEFFRNIIIMFDTGNELFHYITLPHPLYIHDPFCSLISFHLLVWNESIALFGYKAYEGSFGMWVMDDEFDGIKGGWTKHIDFGLYECPLAFWTRDEILMTDGNNSLLSYNLVTKKVEYLPIKYPPFQGLFQDTLYGSKAILYVNSIVSVLRSNSVKNSRNNSSTHDQLVFDIFNNSSLLNHHSIVQKRSHSYSLWVIPPNDVSFRIKKVMEGLRAEFGGPEIEPHINILGSIPMTYEDALNKFLSLRSLSWVIWGQPEVNFVVTRNFYYQCVSLELSELVERCSSEFNINGDPRLHLSLLYGYLTEEERKKAKEIVNVLDESICSMTFPLNRIALYKIDYNDTSLKSWEKIAEFPLNHEDAALHNGRPSWYIDNM